jgi:hypothetical protein
MMIEVGQLRILFDQYGHLQQFQEGPVTARTDRALQRFSNGYYHLAEVERFVPPEKLEAYRRTTYEAGVRIRIGEQVSLEAPWAFVTAWNPGSGDPLPPDINDRRARELEREIEDRWQFRRGQGLPDDAGWTPEPSLLILGISQDDAITLGRRYGQNAIVVGAPESVAKLVQCFPEG